MPRLIRKALGDSPGLDGAEFPSAGIDVIGDIAILKFGDSEPGMRKRAAEAILNKIKNVKAVFGQEGGIGGEFRLRSLEHLAGEKRTLTVHRENGCAYKVDIEKCYFSPRLATERLRIANETRAEERVLNMFAGVGPFSVLTAKKKKARVVSCELNGDACLLHEENNRINKVAGLVKVLNADARELPSLVEEKFHRILMPHPSKADQFVQEALALAGRGCTVHYYRHVSARDDEEAKEAITDEVKELFPRSAEFSVKRVREVGPRWIEMVADISIN